MQKIGENITIRRFKRLQAKGKLALYVHAGAKIGVLVDYEGADEVGQGRGHAHRVRQAAAPEQGRGSAGHRVRGAQDPGGAREGVRQAAEIAAKMVEGAVNKFLGEITLLGQPFIKDDKQTIEKMLAAKKAKVNAYAFSRGRRGHREDRFAPKSWHSWTGA